MQTWFRLLFSGNIALDLFRSPKLIYQRFCHSVMWNPAQENFSLLMQLLVTRKKQHPWICALHYLHFNQHGICIGTFSQISSELYDFNKLLQLNLVEGLLKIQFSGFPSVVLAENLLEKQQAGEEDKLCRHLPSRLSTPWSSFFSPSDSVIFLVIRLSPVNKHKSEKISRSVWSSTFYIYLK